MKKVLLTLSVGGTILPAINYCMHEEPVLQADPSPQPGPVADNGVCFQSDMLHLLKIQGN